jgi:AraC-like DNA-binding protein
MWKSFYFPGGFLFEKDVSSEIVIYFITEGSINLLINEQKSEIVNSGEMFVIPNGCAYKMEMLTYTCIMSCSFFVESLFSEYLRIDELLSWKKEINEEFTKLPISKPIESYLFILDQNLKDGIDSPYFFDLKRQELFFLLFFYYTRLDLAKFLYYIICEDIQFKKFILNNYQRVKNVQELAKTANYSTSGFIKRFQRYFNESPYRWMQRQKANQILRDITQGEKSFQEIAAEYDFTSYQHFANFCKIQFGFPPTQILDKYVRKN